MQDSQLKRYDMIDLGRYIDVCLRRWYLVLLPALVLAIGVFAFTSTRPARYEAQALVALAKTTTDVSFGTAIQTTSDVKDNSYATTTKRISSFTALVKNASVAEQVLSELQDRLPEQRRSVAALLAGIEGENLPESDLISIRTTAASPDLAQDIANLWAKAYVREVNATYGEVGEGALDAVRERLPSAKADYDRDQAALEALLQETTIEKLERDIQQRTEAVEELTAAQTNVIGDILDDLRQTSMLIQSADALRLQVQAADDASVASSNQALTVLKIHAFGGAAMRQSPLDMANAAQLQPFALQMELTAQDAASLTREEMLQDLDGTIQALETQQTELWAKLEQTLDVADKGSNWSISPDQPSDATTESYTSLVRDSLERQIIELQTELERQESLLLKATAQRDLSWETYDNLVRKEAELSLQMATVGQLVRVGAPAAAKPVDAGVIRFTIAAALAGLILGALAALSLEWWKDYRLRNAAQTRQGQTGDDAQ